MERKITRLRLIVLLLLSIVIGPGTYAQVYQHDFGTANITTHPYTVAPTVLNPDLSGSSWSNSTNAWTSYNGSSGKALGLANSSGTPTITLAFNVAPGKTLNITSFSFWRQRSTTGAQSWAMSINGINVGAGTFPTSGADTGTLPVANPVTGLTGPVTVVLSLSGASGSGTLRLDDFTLNGTVSSGCVAPGITSISPTSGPSNTLVSITGSGFEAGSGTTSVKFGTVESAGFTVVSDTEIKALVPATATTGTVSVTTNGCAGVSSVFTVISSACASLAPPTDLFISEVYDAEAGEGGAIELYNGTNASIDLSQYSIARYGTINGSTPSFTVALNGILAPGGIYIARTATPVCGLTGTPSATLPTGFNENDRLELIKNSTVIDVVQTPSAVGFSIIRNGNAEVPKATYNASDWTLFDTEDCAGLGIHSVSSGSTNNISAQPLSAAVCEGENVQYTVTLSNPASFTFQWKMLNSSGNWVNITDGANFSGTTTAQLTIIDAPLEFNGAQFYCQATSPGCTLVSNAVQLTVSPLPLAVVVPIQPTCTIPTGGLLIVPSVGDGITYSLDGVNFQSGLTFTGIAPGDYTLTLKSSANCISTLPITIAPAPLAPAVADVTVTQSTCTTPTGSITINSPLDAGLTYSLDGALFQTTPTFAGLAPGTYTVTVRTALGCTSVTPTITINSVPAAPVVANTTVTQPTCDTPTGTITVTNPVGAEYTYSTDGTNFQNSPIFAGLTPGNYTVTTQNTGGCTSVTASVTINTAPTAPAVATVSVTQPTCAAPTGTVTVTGPLGAGFSYSIDGTNFQNGTQFANLAPGNYTVTTQNGNGCLSVTPTTVTINAVPAGPAVATTTVTQPNCSTPTGTITVTAPVGGNLSYSIDGTTFQASPVFAGLTPGNYTITTQNTDGCTSVTANVTINNGPAGPDVATTTVTQPTCTNTTGTITVTAPAGQFLTYSIDGTTFQSSMVFAGLAPGNYIVTVRTSGGCTSTTGTITINAVPAGPAVATTTVTQPTCAAATGTIVVNSPTGAGFTYSIDGTNFQTGTTFAGLAPGNYTITAQNADGCTSVTANITIDAPVGAPAVATTTVTQPTCAITTGTIVITNPTGAGFTYSIDGTNFQAGTSFAGLAPGNYTVTTQSGTCTSVTGTITINAAPASPAVATTNVTQPTCATPTGSISVTAPLGAQYTYSIDGTNFQASPDFTNLASGSYTVTTQSNGCTSTATVTIDAVPGAPAVATYTVTQPNCSGTTTGTIVVDAPVGAGYSYSIDGTNFQNTTTFAGLTPGNYMITTQNSGCSSVTGTITINPVPTAPAVATYAVTQPTCNVPSGTITVSGPTGPGFTYSLDGMNFQSGTTFSNLAGGAYMVTVMNDGGCTSTTGIINIDNDPTPAVATTTVVQPDCFNNVGRIDVTAPTGSGFSYSIDGTNFQNGTGFINLAPGNYTITVKNINGCTSTASVTINDQPQTPVNPVLTATQPTCATGLGSITVTAPLDPAYSYSIDGINFQSGTEFAGLAPGEYTVSVMSNGGCKSQETTITLSQPVADFTLSTNQGCEGDTFGSSYMIQVAASGDIDGNTATYTWTKGGEQVAMGQGFNVTEYIRSNNIASDSFPLTFNVIVTTAGGCSATQTVTVDGAFCGIPKGISPNNDGMNDTFDVSGMNVKKLSIYNRYGQEIYTKNDYSNEWMGQTNNDDEAPTGTYYYVIEQGGKSFTGWVYINREQ